MLRHGGKARKAKRHYTARTPCALRYWEKNKKGAMLKHYPSFQEFILAQRHLQSPSRTPSHQPPLSSEPGSARTPLFCHCPLSASPCPCCTRQVFSTTTVLVHTHPSTQHRCILLPPALLLWCYLGSEAHGSVHQSFFS